MISNKENVSLTGTGTVGHFQIGFYVNNSKNVDISRVNFKGNGISIYSANSSEFLIDNNRFYTNTAGSNSTRLVILWFQKMYLILMIFLLFPYLVHIII